MSLPLRPLPRPSVPLQHEIDTPEGCRLINNYNGSVRFIPTKTLSEWSAFRDISPARGIGVIACTPLETWTGSDGDGGG